VKNRVQLTPALVAALLGSAGWFAFWLIAFRPAPLRSVILFAHPEVVRLVADEATLSQLKTPTLFALPSAKGFSGRFPENRIGLPLTLEKPSSPIRYLPRENSASSGVKQALLMEETAIPQNSLPAPGVTPRAAVSPATATHLFLSPELKARAGDIHPLDIAASGLSGSVRVNLAIRPDGMVESAFFETPVTNTALLSAIRMLPFKPANEKTEGWIDIRFPQEGTEP
jgi:hypothetical protein